LARTGIRWLVFRLHTHLNPLRYFRYHTTKNINFFEFGNPEQALVANPAEIPFFVRPAGCFEGKFPGIPVKTRHFIHCIRAPMNVRIAPGWKRRLNDEFNKEYFRALTEFVRKEYATCTVYPP